MGLPISLTRARIFAVGLFGVLLVAATPDRATDCTPTRSGWDAPVLQMELQKPDGVETLFLEGRIGPDLPMRLKALLADHPDIGEIHFNASGDDRNSAMEAGRILRSAGNFVVHVPPGAGCTGACALLFLSGRIRSVDPTAVFDLGQFYEPSATSVSSADIARQSLGISDYLIRMGVSRRLLTGTLDRENASTGQAPQRQCLTPEELHGYNVANWNE